MKTNGKKMVMSLCIAAIFLVPISAGYKLKMQTEIPTDVVMEAGGIQPPAIEWEKTYGGDQFDHFMGAAQTLGKSPGMTRYLNTQYHAPTPIGEDISLKAWLEMSEGRKTLIKAEMRFGDVMTASCEALFITPSSGKFLRRGSVSK